MNHLNCRRELAEAKINADAAARFLIQFVSCMPAAVFVAIAADAAGVGTIATLVLPPSDPRVQQE